MKNSNNKFDDLLVQLGTGRWNWGYFVVILWYCFFIPAQVLSIVFVAPSVSFTCKIPKEEEIDPTQDLVDSCSYVTNSTSTAESRALPCTDWDFDNSTYTATLTSEYQLICERSFLRAAYHGSFMIGNLFGPPIAGVFSDRYGRKLVAVSGGLVFALTSVILPFIPNFSAILVVRFIMGFANLPTAYILALEICEPEKRSFAGILLALPWALGTMAFGAVAYFIRDWHWLQLIMSLPLVILLPAIWFLDESPRWLIVTGHQEKALAILKKAAKWNGAKLPQDSQLRSIMKDIQQENNLNSAKNLKNNSLTESLRTSSKSGVTYQSRFACLLKCGLCRTVHIRIVTLCLTLCFYVSSVVFHGLTLSSGNFSVDVFVYIIVGGLAEVPAYTLPAFVVAKFGRRVPISLFFLVCGLSLLLLTMTPSDITWLIIVLAMVGKLGISSAGQMVYLYLSELYPTEYRLQGMGMAILAQRLGSITAPLMVQILGPLSWWAPSVVMGALAVLAGMATLILPETLGAILPDTLDDLDDLFAMKKGKKRKMQSEEMNMKSGDALDTAGELTPMQA